MNTLINGVQTNYLSVRDRGLHYGDGCFETIRLHNRVPLLLDRHLTRLEQGCALLHIPCDSALLRDELELLVAASAPDGVIKLIVTRGEGGRGYRSEEMPRATRILLYYPLPPMNTENANTGVTLGVSAYRLSRNTTLAGVKHLNRLDQVMASLTFEDGVDEYLCLDEAGAVIEGTRSNLVLVIENRLVTPALDGAGVTGVMLTELAARFANDGHPIGSRELSLMDLQQASELFLCNSVIGVWPVRKLVENASVRTWPVGPLSQQALRYSNELILAAN